MKRKPAPKPTNASARRLNPEASELILFELLGRMDGIFAPMREWRSKAQAVACERRNAFFLEGLQWASGVTKANARKQIQRSLEDLVKAGDVRAIRKGGRTVAVRLSEECEARLRRLVALPAMPEALAWLDRLAALLTSEPWPGRFSDRRQNWVHEWAFAGITEDAPDCGQAFAGLAADLSALLCRGLVLAKSDAHGRVSYCLSAEGKQLAAERMKAGSVLPWPVAPRNDDNVSWPGYEEYERTYRLTMKDIANAAPLNGREIGMIGLPVCGEHPVDEDGKTRILSEIQP